MNNKDGNLSVWTTRAQTVVRCDGYDVRQSSDDTLLILSGERCIVHALCDKAYKRSELISISKMIVSLRTS